MESTSQDEEVEQMLYNTPVQQTNEDQIENEIPENSQKENNEQVQEDELPPNRLEELLEEARLDGESDEEQKEERISPMEEQKESNSDGQAQLMIESTNIERVILPENARRNETPGEVLQILFQFDNKSEGLDISHIFSKLSALKMEIRKRQSVINQYAEFGRGNQEFTKVLKKSIQNQIELYELQEKLCPFNSKIPGINATHGSNPVLIGQERPIKQVVEEAIKLFSKERLYRLINDLLFTIRGNSQLTAELFRYIQEPMSPRYEMKIRDRAWLRVDPQTAEIMAWQLLDNPFQDTSRTQDQNLLYFNTLRAYHCLLNPLPQIQLNPQQQRQNNIMTREQLSQHISTSIFYALIKTVDAQSYLRYIYKNIFSKINLIQLIAFINEKEAIYKQRTGLDLNPQVNLQGTGQAQGSATTMFKGENQLYPSTPNQAKDDNYRKQAVRVVNQGGRANEEQKDRSIPPPLSQQPLSAFPVTPNAKQSNGALGGAGEKPAQSEEFKKEKKGFFQKIFGLSKTKEEDKQKRLQAKAEKERKDRALKNQHYTDVRALKNVDKMIENYEKSQGQDQGSGNIRGTQVPGMSSSKFVKDDDSIHVPSFGGLEKQTPGHRRELSNGSKVPMIPDSSNTNNQQNFGTLQEASLLQDQYRQKSLAKKQELQTINEETQATDQNMEFQPQDTMPSSSNLGEKLQKNTYSRKNTDDESVRSSSSSLLNPSPQAQNEEQKLGGSPNPAQNASAAQTFDDMMRQGNRPEDNSKKGRFTINQYDLTGYMLHILMKVSEILYLSVCQIPTPIRSFVKILSESIQNKNPQFSKIELYRILNELIVDRWLSISFQQPEFFGILPKPLNFNDKYKNIFFHTAQRVLQQMFRMETIDTLPQYQDYFDIERINEYIKHQRENIMVYYEYFLNIDISVYENTPKQQNSIDVIALKAEVMQRLIAIINYDGERFFKLEPKLEEIIDRIDSIERIDSMDQQYGVKVSDAAVEINITAQLAEHQEVTMEDLMGKPEQIARVFLFVRMQDTNMSQMRAALKKRLEQETDQFMNQYGVVDKAKFKQLIRNMIELVEQPEVQFPSFYQIVRNKQHEHLGNDLSVILFYLIRGDECLNHTKETDDKDKMRLQCIILYKNLQTTGVMGNIGMQCRILQHIIDKIRIEIQWFSNGEQNQSDHNGPFDQDLSKFVSLDDISLLNHCIDQDLRLFQENMRIERDYCEKIKHAYDLTNFILMVKPFVCLNYDHNGFNLVRQDRCDRHQANPLLTGQLLFGIVQTNNPQVPGGAGALPVNRNMAGRGQGPQNAGMGRGGLPQNRAGQPNDPNGMNNQQPRDKLKHYQIKRIDFFIIAFQNKFRSQFRQLIALDTLGRSQNDIDYMNLRTTYSQFLHVIRNLLDNDQALKHKVAQSLTEINEYIMKQLHRHIFVIIEPSQLDFAIQRNLQKKNYSFEKLNIPEELRDDALWQDAICTFDKFSKEETPVDKLMVIARTMRILNQIFNMASIKEGKQAAAEEEYNMLTYVVSKSISAFKLYSNFQFIKLFGQGEGAANNLQRSLSTLESVIMIIIGDDNENNNQQPQRRPQQ